MKVGRLTLGLLLVTAGAGVWLFLRRSLLGGSIAATAVLIVLWWGVR